MIGHHFSYDDILLGVTVNKNSTIFRLWSSSATNVYLNIYAQWDDLRRQTYALKKIEPQLWHLEIPKNLEDYYYTYSVDRYGTLHEIVDPYAIATSPNSKKGQIITLLRTNPDGWDMIKRPKIDLMNTVIYETHIRDITVKWHEDERLQGTYNGVNEDIIKKIKELGITHIQWMPLFDFATLDDLGKGYNWGYDPLLFNVVEGSYASDVSDPLIRIKELKSMIMRCHKMGVRVIMDVVYNHTYHSKTSNLNRVGDHYFYRMVGRHFSNGSGCGNELATENKMVRKFIIDSLLYWQKEYKIDGFRFDLMGLYDIETVEAIEKALRANDPETLLYGEPWTGAGSALPYDQQFKKGVIKNGGVGYFNDDFRNSVKGDNDSGKRGYIGGVIDSNILLNTLMGSPIDTEKLVGYSHYPYESINYFTSHDNLNLFDKVSKSFPKANENDKKKICGLCFSILLTSVGIPFIQGGAEMMVSKKGFHNTYNMSDEINAYNWELSSSNADLRRYIQKLIEFRHNTFLYQMTDFESINECCNISINEKGIILMKIDDFKHKENHLIFHNGSEHDYDYILQNGRYNVVCSGECFMKGKDKKTIKDRVKLPAYQTVILKEINS